MKNMSLQSRRRFLKDASETRSECGGNVNIIASIEDPVVIRKILAHLDQNVSLQQVTCLPESRAPPAMGLLV